MTQTQSLRCLLRSTLSALSLGDKPIKPATVLMTNHQHQRQHELMKFCRFGTTSLLKEKKLDSFGFIAERNSLGFSDKLFGSYEQVTPQVVSEKRGVPDGILLPDYLQRPGGLPPKPSRKKLKNAKIEIKSNEDIKKMRESCRLARYVLEHTMNQIKPGMTTDQLDRFAHDLIVKNKAYPSALLYKNFPKSICTSVNNVACHGIPDTRKLISGDIISLDVMVFKNGFHGDCAATELVGNVDEQGKTLVDAAEDCLIAGIGECGPNKPFDNIGKAIETRANEDGYSVLHVFTGHGVGKNIHESPDIFHYDRGIFDPDHVMKPGMIFTIEPIITQGMDMIRILSDGWTAVTIDGARAAQFEHTLLITETGVEILTEFVEGK